MTEQPATDVTDDLQMTLSATLRSGGDGQIILRHLALGMDPMILIEVDLDDSTENLMHVRLDTTGFDRDELSAFLTMMSIAVRENLSEVEAPDAD